MVTELVAPWEAMGRRAADRRSLAFTCCVDELLPNRIVTDPGVLNTIVAHLLANAVTYTRAGSVTLNIRVRASTFVIEVSDTGIGVPTYAAAAVLHGKKANGDPTPGTGLPTIRTLSYALGGHLMMVSTPGSGSTFSVTLPLVDPDETKPIRT